MSALFEYTQGAFTGALKDRDGLLRAADGGVLFLDEIEGKTRRGRAGDAAPRGGGKAVPAARV
ncbi:MAG: sigma 54-interacting transcriptional regulator [Verrucomicrobiales bacterium]